MRFNLTHHWYHSKQRLMTLLLLPFSWLFSLGITFRRLLYRYNIKKKYQFPIPVIVVGNITVGGTGKTPFVIWLAKCLKAHGYHPGIVSRGVGGKKHLIPYQVSDEDIAEQVGDEAVLLKRHTHCPLVICIDRAAAVRSLLHSADCDVVISDDGLQHYRLARDIEIALIDAKRGMGNQCLLPAGPLREPLSRLQQVDFIILNGEEVEHTLPGITEKYAMSYLPSQLVSLVSKQEMNLADFANKTVHAIAGIGHPERFFSMLRKAGLNVIPHIFPDHYLYQAQDIHFADALPILMTEKDAVKCRAFADDRYWYLTIAANIHSQLEQDLLLKLKSSGTESRTISAAKLAKNTR